MFFSNSLLKYIFSIVLFFLFENTTQSQKCNPKKISKEVRKNIAPPYLYSSSEISELTFGQKEKKVIVQFTALKDIKYKLLFCSSNFEEQVRINIYDKSKAIKDRKKVYDNSQGVDNNYWVFEPPKHGKYYIEYDVPKSIDGTVKQGCVILVVGYLEEDIETVATKK